MHAGHPLYLPLNEASVNFLRCPAILLLFVVVGAHLGCASGEIDQNDQNENGDAGILDATPPDADGSDADTDIDPCAECADDEVCVDDACVDPCTEQGVECGSTTWEGDEYDCGGCPAGECDEGSCPDICGAFYAECGDVFWEGNVHDCGNCAGGRRCRSNRCTDDDGFVAVSAGRSHTCAVTHLGSINCWGQNDYGQLGDTNMSEHSSIPVTVAQIGDASELSSVNHHACTTRSGGDVYCWGRNNHGQLGDGTTDDADSPVAADDIAAFSVTTGSSHTCAIVDGERLQCWGDNEFGQLGNGGEPMEDYVIRAGGELDAVVDLALGATHSCAVRRDNDLWCWGGINSGQLGRGHTQDGPLHAEETELPAPVHTVSSSFNHTCVIAVGGDIYCWGHGNHGQLGHGERSDSPSPVEVELSAPAVDIATGRFHTCAATDDGDVFCWGDNNSAQIGQGTASGHFEVPAPVAGIADAVAVAAGGGHSCALERDGTIKCWGDNEYGQIGDASDDDKRRQASEVAD